MSITNFIKTSLIPKLDIVEIIKGAGVTLKKGGSNYKGLCPFHNEKTPSFTVYPQQQTYHCYGCGAHGDVIDFLESHDNLVFFEAFKEACQMAGVDYKEIDKNVDLRLNLYEINQIAANFFIDHLKKNKNAQDYLARRGINQDSIEKFKIGCTPPYGNGLKKYLADRGITKSAIDLGLLSPDGAYDKFRNRLIIPITDERGIVAFNGRAMNDSKPKYLHTKETELFKKSKTVFNIQEIKKKRFDAVVLLEGAFDVISCTQEFEQLVNPARRVGFCASLGGAVSDKQISLILRHTSTIVICADGDDAGRKATRRAIENAVLPAYKEGSIFKIFLMPHGYDADSYIQEYGFKAYLKLAKTKTLQLSEYIFTELVLDGVKTNPITPEDASKIQYNANRVVKPMIKKALDNKTAYYKSLIKFIDRQVSQLTGTTDESHISHTTSPTDSDFFSTTEGRIALILEAYPELKTGRKDCAVIDIPPQYKYINNIEAAKFELEIITTA